MGAVAIVRIFSTQLSDLSLEVKKVTFPFLCSQSQSDFISHFKGLLYILCGMQLTNSVVLISGAKARDDVYSLTVKTPPHPGFTITVSIP